MADPARQLLQDDGNGSTEKSIVGEVFFRG